MDLLPCKLQIFLDLEKSLPEPGRLLDRVRDTRNEWELLARKHGVDIRSLQDLKAKVSSRYT